jgi:hypothetical protein
MNPAAWELTVDGRFLCAACALPIMAAKDGAVFTTAYFHHQPDGTACEQCGVGFGTSPAPKAPTTQHMDDVARAALGTIHAGAFAVWGEVRSGVDIRAMGDAVADTLHDLGYDIRRKDDQ